MRSEINSEGKINGDTKKTKNNSTFYQVHMKHYGKDISQNNARPQSPWYCGM
jgi:hypothetical protein